MKVNYRRPKLYDRQLECFFNNIRFSFIEGSTKAGKTVSCMAWLLEECYKCKRGENVWWVAPVYPQAKIAFRRFKKGLTKGTFKANESELFIELANGAIMWFKTAEKPDNLYGEDVHAIVIDEASRCREEAWEALNSTLTATRGPLRAIGNVKGKGNWFYRMCRKAESGDYSNMFYGKITAEHAMAAGVLDPEEIEDAKNRLPKHVFDQLYYCIPADDGGNPFGTQSIEDCVGELSNKPAVAFGVDLAKSVDYTVIIGLDEDMNVCYFDRFQKNWQETTPYIASVVGSTAAAVDATGVGSPVVESLQENGYDNYEGYVFTGQSKQKLMGGLALAIHQRSVTYPDNEIRKELDIFEYEETRTGVKYSAPEGFHDDCVMALGLAVYMYNSRPAAPEIRIL